ncbi:MAG: Glucokinase [Candidatus Ozemobacter sibiricus]|jgi:glucokinase|uniref:Glucokinase n=1 Tax=Candidatus Ozemobacter sibiricus TaxID=2268124 RepID=A0A367ZME1_9BACT|nr:MAG: Glucokinase [Candidatus Ozemobacter sibiricus]
MARTAKSKGKNSLTIGIDLGGTKIAAGLCREGEVLHKVVVPTNAAQGFDAVVAAMAEAARQAMGDTDPAAVRGVGVGAAGQIDSQTGAVLYAPNLNWRQAPLGQKLAEALRLPVRVVNDVRAATMAEWKYGAGKGLHSFINIFLGTGVGSGLVLNGTLCEGATNTAGEIGHICLDPAGPLCGCGHAGCFEAYSSGRGIENEVKRRLQAGAPSALREKVGARLDQITGPLIGQAAREGDPLALEVLAWAGRHLGLVLANLHTLLNPQKILLGGGVMALADFFLPAAREAMHRHILSVADRGEDLLGRARFENDAVLLGGSALFA